MGNCFSSFWSKCEWAWQRNASFDGKKAAIAGCVTLCFVSVGRCGWACELGCLHPWQCCVLHVIMFTSELLGIRCSDYNIVSRSAEFSWKILEWVSKKLTGEVFHINEYSIKFLYYIVKLFFLDINHQDLHN